MGGIATRAHVDSNLAQVECDRVLIRDQSERLSAYCRRDGSCLEIRYYIRLH